MIVIFGGFDIILIVIWDAFVNSECICSILLFNYANGCNIVCVHLEYMFTIFLLDCVRVLKRLFLWVIQNTHTLIMKFKLMASLHLFLAFHCRFWSAEIKIYFFYSALM